MIGTVEIESAENGGNKKSEEYLKMIVRKFGRIKMMERLIKQR